MKMGMKIAIALLSIILLGISAEEYRLSSNTKPTEYNLHIKLDVENLKFEGAVTISLMCQKNTTTVELHHADLNVTEIRLESGNKNYSVNATSYNDKNNFLTISFNETLMESQQYSLYLEFNGRIRTDLKGIHKVRYYEANEERYYISTYSAAAYARLIFPCYDEPGIKANLILRITYLNQYGYTAISNMNAVSDEKIQINDNEYISTEFQKTPPISTYLITFTVSNLTKFSNSFGNFSVYTHPHKLTETHYSLEIGQKLLQELSKFVDLKYQLPKMDFIASDELLSNAMEHWGFITYRYQRLLVSDGRDSRAMIQSTAKIISHELIHQYYGNEVTCEFWFYVWGNEGFAAYLESFILDIIHSDWRLMDQFLVKDMHDVLEQDADRNVRPMTKPVETLDEIGAVYDFVVYPKSASVIRMIEHVFGKNLFQEAMKFYINNWSEKSATEDDLIASLEEIKNRHNQTDLPDLTKFIKSWTNNPGYPVLTVTQNYEEKTVTFSQKRFVSSKGPQLDSKFFIPINYATTGNSNFDSLNVTYWLENDSSTISVPDLSADEWIIVNKQQTGYYRVNYDQKNWNLIIQELNSENFSKIHPLNRAQIINDLFNFARFDYGRISNIFNALKYVGRELDFIALKPALKAIEFFMRTFDEEEYLKMRQFFMDSIIKIYENFNKQQKELSHFETIAVSEVNLYACQYGVIQCLNDTVKLYEKFGTIEKLLKFISNIKFHVFPPDQRQIIFCGALSNKVISDEPWFILTERLKLILSTEENRRDSFYELNEILYVLASCDSNIRFSYLLTLIFEDHKFVRFSATEGNIIIENSMKSGNEKSRKFLDYYSKNFAAVNRKSSLESTFRAFGKYINTNEHLEIVEKIIKDEKLEENSVVKKSILEMKEKITWIKSKSEEVQTWIKENYSGAVITKFSFLLLTFCTILNFLY